MDLKELNAYYAKFKYGEENFHNLMKRRVKEILLVSTFYDAYMFEHDGRLSDQIVGQYINLNLTTIPRITSVPTADEALNLLGQNSYDLVIMTPRIGKPGALPLAAHIREMYPKLPIILLLTVKSDVALVHGNEDYMRLFDNIFLWGGEPSIVLAMIKYIEDRDNAPYDTEYGLVQVILLVEDSISFYSSYLPLLFKEIMQQTQRLISEELNDYQKYQRMRTRPKVLHARTYEEAVDICVRYRDNLLCVISDVEFPKNGRMDGNAGVDLCKKLREMGRGTPLVLQSTSEEFREQAESVSAVFIHKRSPTLLSELRSFIISNLGFGDFIFRSENGVEYARAPRIDDFERILPNIPDSVLVYHASRNHFSTWLIAHGEFQVARKMRPVGYEDFVDPLSFRRFLINSFKEVRVQRNRGKILKFSPNRLMEENMFTQMQEGSLGGKGRGIAFFNALMATIDFSSLVKGIRVAIPPTVAIGSLEYEDFISRNKLYECYDRTMDDAEVGAVFMAARLSEPLRDQLAQYLHRTRKPLAVRSSGLLEDSQAQPFAGIYKTYMIPNNSASFKERLEYLEQAVKLVFASVFRKSTKAYLANLNFRIEEERMAVIIQEVVGDWFGHYYFPHISGVAQSYNYYPISGVEPEHGVAAIAVGLGHFVVEGERVYRFCPAYPMVQFMSQEDYVRYSQTSFYAVDCSERPIDLNTGEHSTLVRLPIDKAEEAGILGYCASVWDPVDRRIQDTLSIPGPRVVTFSNLLRDPSTPLAETLSTILQISEIALGTPVEIEFAMNLPLRGEGSPVFYLLQARPLFYPSVDTIENREREVEGRTILFSEKSMGNGLIEGIRDIVYVPPERFDKGETIQIQGEIEEINEICVKEGRNYILIGPGRWGSRDRFLGIPVAWSQISNAKLIVEYGLEDFHPEPSQGTHFFHLLLSMGIGYLSIPCNNEVSYIDWDLLGSLSPRNMGNHCRRVTLEKPLYISINGEKGHCRVVMERGEA